MEIGNRIKKQRLKLKWTQKKLATKLCLTPKMISFYENNQRTPPPDIIKRLAEIFNISSDYLLGLCEEDESNINSFKITVNKIEKELIENFRNLDNDYKNIIWGEIIKCNKLQEHERSLNKNISSGKKHA